MWRGGASLLGVTAPDATLRNATAVADDHLQRALVLARKGARPDTVIGVCTQGPTPRETPDTGALYAWEEIFGAPLPAASSMVVPGAVQLDLLGF